MSADCRRNKHGSKEDIARPPLFIDSNRYMYGVDKFDQINSVYEINRKSQE